MEVLEASVIGGELGVQEEIGIGADLGEVARPEDVVKGELIGYQFYFVVEVRYILVYGLVVGTLIGV